MRITSAERARANVTSCHSLCAETIGESGRGRMAMPELSMSWLRSAMTPSIGVSGALSEPATSGSDVANALLSSRSWVSSRSIVDR